MADRIPLFEIAWDEQDILNAVESIGRGGYWAKERGGLRRLATAILSSSADTLGWVGQSRRETLEKRSVTHRQHPYVVGRTSRGKQSANSAIRVEKHSCIAWEAENQ